MDRSIERDGRIKRREEPTLEIRPLGLGDGTGGLAKLKETGEVDVGILGGVVAVELVEAKGGGKFGQGGVGWVWPGVCMVRGWHVRSVVGWGNELSVYMRWVTSRFVMT